MTYIQKLVSNPINRVIITGPASVGSLVGYVEAEQVFGATSSYSPLIGNSSSETIDKGTQLVNSVTGWDIPRAANPLSTRVGWENAAVNGLSFGLYFISYDGSNVMDQIKPVWGMVLPSKGAVNSFVAPGDYKPNQKGDVENSLSIEIGNWFSAHGFVMDSALLTVSREKVDTDGKLPLYVKLDISLKPCETYTADIVSSWFK